MMVLLLLRQVELSFYGGKCSSIFCLFYFLAFFYFMSFFYGEELFINFKVIAVDDVPEAGSQLKRLHYIGKAFIFINATDLPG